ncbi:uncharacterized protein N7483_006506 [Penicillium malachiteum]|uniref:uncharacterized protein n=1 Tax=Penicillium malachiteum TaxID=1324776 RepID=UPI0025465A05|nr:uncharacterized protein N7483_006506 [Penicillium malachiteum]KAJ5725149.1 hypothetical protein N7483_006506 [Penicillium malachiteum]
MIATANISSGLTVWQGPESPPSRARWPNTSKVEGRTRLRLYPKIHANDSSPADEIPSYSQKWNPWRAQG